MEGDPYLLLPRAETKEAYARIYADDQIWLPAMRAIAVRHGLSGNPVRQTLGTHVVYGIGDLIVKLFAPPWPDGFRAERAALGFMRGLTTPQVVAEGELEGWPYLIVTRLAGVPIGDVWSELDRENRHELIAQLGAMMRRIHQLGMPEAMPDTWQPFLTARLEGAVEHHNLGQPWRTWIADQLGDFHEPPAGRVLLHGDLTADHLLVQEQGGRWRLTGLIDFGDARVGHPFYEFAVPLLDFVYGEPEFSGVLLDAYGLPQTQEVSEALTKYCLLHEFATLDDHLERCPAASPEDFLRLLWGTRV